MRGKCSPRSRASPGNFLTALDQGSAAHHRAAAARTRRLPAEATTPRVKEQLAAAVAKHDQIAIEVEPASARNSDAASNVEMPVPGETPGR